MPKTEADFPLDGAEAFELLRLATIYHEQANVCRKEGARLASCVMLGATVEAMLIAVINLFCDEARAVAIEKKLNLEESLRWDFGCRQGRETASGETQSASQNGFTGPERSCTYRKNPRGQKLGAPWQIPARTRW
jgi:hypothetical protein